jgi:hypothetical protein
MFGFIGSAVLSFVKEIAVATFQFACAYVVNAAMSYINL